ncbi:translation elongation factor 4 [Candidatus Nanoperiomorbus periodonticus]|uniref:translation elongation factor 4 n=1 Tax=Candidatus Nanoperiomorbus periodonticus TaxID=2171989 RepID=UPI00101C47BF|nr:translation elongation factor 4 [Candidatus Nanoperiomorbus periodonticus]RYC75705.1 Elongation factor 4 [Candidatus Nanoperiomorbus periodonticus]
MTSLANLRNFCIIAHIDHGKSTLADRMMELTGTVEKRAMKQQLLDSMELEREKGITIKLSPVRMRYRGYDLNLIDTPGHVDFSYEVSRSLEACEGAVLVVDATQGIQAQTLTNVYLAMEANLTIIPVLNKIDLPASDTAKVSAQLISLLGCEEADIIKVSAKTGQNVDRVLEAIIKRIPAPQGDQAAPTRALIFDSYYDDYRGVVLYVRLVDGQLAKGASIRMMATGAKALALEVGHLAPGMMADSALATGQIGYIVTNLKTTREARVGDTVTVGAGEPDSAKVKPLPGYRDVKPFVYAGFFPTSNEYYDALKEAVEKLSLSDSVLHYTPENSPVLGFGLRLGFLGLLHMDIVRERLEREYGLELIVTNPSTSYQVKLTDGTALTIESADELPDRSKIISIAEPWIGGEIVVPVDYVGSVIQLIVKKRGLQKSISYIGERAVIDFEAPMANLLTDFYDQLKSLTSGYGTYNYDLIGYREGDLVRVDFYVAGELVSALSLMCHRSESAKLGREVVRKLKEVIPRQQFAVSLQAGIGGKFIAREDLSSYRKDVTVKIHTGDPDRRAKLLDKQRRGKKRMKRFGKVDIPADAFTVMLKRD